MNMEDQAARRMNTNAEGSGDWRVHTADDTTSTNAAAKPKRCISIGPRDCRPRTAARSAQRAKTRHSRHDCGLIRAGHG